MMSRVERLGDGPIIGPETHSSIGTNIQGPSLIRVPGWVSNPLGRYYLYFADHKGGFIRLAFADNLIGPWTVHPPGALDLADSCFPTALPLPTEEEMEILVEAYEVALGADAMPEDVRADVSAAHIASPDVHVDHEHRRIVMYFHGLEHIAHQVTRVAVSSNGLNFTARPEVLGKTYFRAFALQGVTYALAMPGQLYRSVDGLSNFEPGPLLFEPAMRHSAVRVLPAPDDEVRVEVYWTRAGDAPERIYRSLISGARDWAHWSVGEAEDLLRPEHDWEGASEPMVASRRGTAHGPVNGLRDPAIFEEAGTVYLLYAAAGESGIAIATVED